MKYLLRANENISVIDNVLITHFHGDHYFDIPFYLLYKSKRNDKNVNIYSYKLGFKKMTKLCKLAFPNLFKNIYSELCLNMINKDKFVIDNYNISKILMDYGRLKPAYGYIFNFLDKNIGFTGDTSLCKNVEYMASICNYLFCDCMKIVGDKKHMGIDNIKYLSEKYKKCMFVVSHLDDNTRESLLSININNVIVPVDGELIKMKY